MLSAFTSLFRAATPTFSDYETAILDAIMAELDEPLRARFAQRLASITHIRRADSGRQIAVSQQARGRIVPADDTRLTTREGEIPLARFSVISRRTLSALQGQAWLSDGQFSRLSFTQPTEHAQHDDVHRISVKLEEHFASAEAAGIRTGTDDRPVPLRASLGPAEKVPSVSPQKLIWVIKSAQSGGV